MTEVSEKIQEKAHKECPECGDEWVRYNPFNGETTAVFLDGEADNSTWFDGSDIESKEVIEFCNNAGCELTRAD